MTYIYKNASYIIGLIIWLVYFILVYQFSSSAPFMDDYDLYLKSLINLKEANGFQEKLITLFAQHNEHRPFIPRIIALVDLKINGWLNLKILIIIGNIALFLTWLKLIQHLPIKEPMYKWLVSTGIIFIITGLQSTENIFWATGALQNYLTILSIVCSLSSLSKGNYWWGVIYFIFAISCSITGFILAPFIIIPIFIKKKFIKASCITVVISIIVFAYFYSYHPIQHSTKNHYTGFIPTIKYFFAFIGSSFSFYGINLPLAYLGGVSVFILSAYIIIKTKRRDFWWMICVFILVSAFIAVYSRSNLGVLQALSSRYRIFSELIFISLVAMFIINYSKYKKALSLGFFCLGLIFLVTQIYVLKPVVENNKKMLDTGMIVFVRIKNPAYLMYPAPPVAAERLIRAYEKHIYKPDL